MGETILYADDEPKYRSLMRLLMEREGYTVVTTEDGPGVLAEAARNPDVGLVILDVLMPGMDGWEVCRRLRADERTAAIPVIFLTALGHGPSEARGLDEGAVDYVAKPFTFDALRARVRSHLGARRHAERLEVLARADALTGLPNRRAFDEALRREWDRAARARVPLGLVMLDVDHFKAFNDTHGHPGGDACLAAVAAALRGVLQRPSDTAARYGGEEFALVLPDVDAAGAATVAERARLAVLAVAIPHGSSSASPLVTVSAGAASVRPPEGGGPAGLVERADAMLLAAKDAGRNRALADLGASAGGAR